MSKAIFPFVLLIKKTVRSLERTVYQKNPPPGAAPTEARALGPNWAQIPGPNPGADRQSKIHGTVRLSGGRPGPSPASLSRRPRAQ